MSRLSLLLFLAACVSVPVPVYDPPPRADVRVGDFDRDGVPDLYVVRSEKARRGSYHVDGCGSSWRNRVTVTRTGSNGASVLAEVIWCADDPISATGLSPDGFYVKEGKRWKKVKL